MTTAANQSPSSPLRLILLIWLFAFFAFAGTTILGWHPVARLVGVLLYGVPVLAWALFRWRSVDRLDLAVIAVVIGHLAVSLLSLDRESSLEMSAAVLAYAATFWLGRRVAADPRLRRLFALAVSAAVCFWLVVLAVTWIGEKVSAVQILGWPPVLDAHQPYVWGSINTPPALALLVGAFIAWLPAGNGRRVLFALWIASAIVVVPLSVGRAGWLGIGVAALSLEPLLGFRLTRSAIAAVRRANPLGRAAVGMSASALAAGLVMVLMRGGEMLAAAMDSRLRLWQQAMSLFAADPLTGAGPSTFGWARLAHVPDYVDRVAAKDAHSIPLQTLTDGGLVLAVAMVVVVGAWVSLLIERRTLLSVPQRLSIAVLVGYAAMGFLDDLSFLPAVTVMLLLLSAWAIPAAPGMPRTMAARRFVVPATMLAVALVTAPALISMTSSRLAASDGRDAAVSGDWADALAAFEDAASLHPSNAQQWMSVGLAAAMAGDPDVAVHAYERARAISTGDPRPWGALAELTADEPTRIGLLDAATRRSNDARYAYRLGIGQLDAGRVDEAVQSLAIAAALQPEWFASTPRDLWPPIRDALPDAIGTVGSIGGHQPEEAWWNAGLALGDLPGNAPAPWRAVALALDGDGASAVDVLNLAGEQGADAARVDQAASALARLACDRHAFEDAERRIAARGLDAQEGGHPIKQGPAGIYRDAEIGDYQPITGRTVDVPPAWPLGLVEVPDCGW